MSGIKLIFCTTFHENKEYPFPKYEAHIVKVSFFSVCNCEINEDSDTQLTIVLIHVNKKVALFGFVSNDSVTSK